MTDAGTTHGAGRVSPGRPDDLPQRRTAAATFDRNVVVTAGAGTGKTTLLVDRLIHLLIREPDPLRLPEIVALTFTRKAADEMRIRLRERLHRYFENLGGDLNDLEVIFLMKQYRLSREIVEARAREALRLLDRTEIGTLHGFAASLLRLYPLEAGLDPRFREDDGEGFETHFEASWGVWLDRELAADAPRKEAWKRVLGDLSLVELRELAWALSPETIPLETVSGASPDTSLPPAIRVWFSDLEQRASALLTAHPENRNIEKLTRAAVNTLASFLRDGNGSGVTGEERDLLTGKEPAAVKGWTAEEVAEAKEIVRAARRLLSVDGGRIREILDLLLPFVTSCREAFIQAGWISFDGLLVRARNLLRDHPPVREALKRRYRSILVDEFQDTDPIQYEILLFLAEIPGQTGRTWREIRLTPGKLFVVGDPKQSIYAFRRADMEAYLRVVREVIEGEEGRRLTLTGNFRSHGGILDAVNGVFSRLIRPREGLQPEYSPVYPAAEGSGEENPFRKVALRLVRPPEKMDADSARRLEGESLARWLAGEVLGKAAVRDREGKELRVTPRHVALLMRSLQSVDAYLEPLRRRGIPYVVEGEKHFFGTRTVIDAVHLLRAVDNPDDTLALAGVLRSPLGGVTDAALYDLKSRDLLDYRKEPPPGIPGAEGAGELFAALRRLHGEAPRLPAGEAVSRIFEQLPLLLLAARSRDGEQGTANLEKILRIAREQEEGGISLRGLIVRLARWVAEGKEEGEGLLAEETVDAVRVLSIHKAKGLEFPVVILAGCHTAPAPSDRERTEVWTDWSTGLTGIKVGEFRDLPSVFLAEKGRAREAEETRRVFYVAMTRAREHLTLSGVLGGKRSRGSFLSFLEEAVGEIPDEEGPLSLSAGEGRIDLRLVPERFGPPETEESLSSSVSPEVDWEAYAERWKKRMEEYRLILQSPRFVTPTGLMALDEKILRASLGDRTGSSFPRKRESRGLESWIPASAGMTEGKDPSAVRVGTLAHRFLQGWDFAIDPAAFPKHLASFLNRFAGEGDEAREALYHELDGIFRVFFHSPVYETLRRGTILGREVPWVMAHEGRIVEGVIDLLYETAEGEIRGADYKTDRIEPAKAAEDYRLQVEFYRSAAGKALGRDLDGFDLILLRSGERVFV